MVRRNTFGGPTVFSFDKISVLLFTDGDGRNLGGAFANSDPSWKINRAYLGDSLIQNRTLRFVQIT